MIIYTAPSRMSVVWTKEELTFFEFIQRLHNPYRSPETYEEFIALPKDRQDALKDIGGYVGGILKDGRRKQNSIISRTLIALDADKIDGQSELKRIKDKLEELGFSYVLHSTKKSTKEKPRLRILLPLQTPIAPEVYEPVVRTLCNEIGMKYFDSTTVDVNRLMYWPSVCKDQEYVFDYRLIESLDAVSFLKEQNVDIDNESTWAVFDKDEKVIRDSRIKQEDPITKNNYVGTFCRAYTVPEAIETFIPDVYNYEGGNRYTYANGTTSGGAICYDDKWLYSYHDSDPISEKECNAFDLVRIQKFGDTKKSYDQMLEFIQTDKKYKEQRMREIVDEFQDIDLDEAELEDSLNDLYDHLDLTKKGVIKNTIDNYYQILSRDPKLKDKYHYDIFANRRVVSGCLPWHNEEETLPRHWVDSDESNLRHYIEKVHGLGGGTKLQDAIAVAFSEHMIHPVRDYLNNLETWDEKPRIETLLIDYFGAEDNVYVRESMRKVLIAAVARIYKPGTKFDNVPVLIGKQGTGKSTFINTLSPVNEWYVDTDPRFEGKEAFETLQNKWLIEFGELKSLSRKEVERIKQYISKQSDYYRLPYAKNPEDHPRQCIFIGTTNNQTFLNDTTGNRRFWPIQLGVNKPKKDIWSDLENERDQIWAEAKYYYSQNESLLLSKEANKLAEKEQENRMEDDPRRGEIIEFIKRKIPVNWNSFSLASRAEYWLSPRSNTDEKKYRDRICAREILQERYSVPEIRVKSNVKEINSLLDSIEGLEKINGAQKFGKEYGNQRGYWVKEEFYDTHT